MGDSADAVILICPIICPLALVMLVCCMYNSTHAPTDICNFLDMTGRTGHSRPMATANIETDGKNDALYGIGGFLFAIPIGKWNSCLYSISEVSRPQYLLSLQTRTRTRPPAPRLTCLLTALAVELEAAVALGDRVIAPPVESSSKIPP